MSVDARAIAAILKMKNFLYIEPHRDNRTHAQPPTGQVLQGDDAFEPAVKLQTLLSKNTLPQFFFLSARQHPRFYDPALQLRP